MTYITHADTSFDIGGTHLQGYARTTFDKLVRLFGKPIDGDGYKTDVEWIVLFSDGTLATIYNWKNGPAYLGDMASISAIDEWNIGGHNPAAVERVIAALEET